MNLELDFEKELNIDPDALDVELVRQPGLYFRYSKMLAEAEKKVSSFKDELSMVRADLDKEIRSNAGDKKPTENQITNAINADERYGVANAKLIEALYEMNVIQGAVRAMDHRKSALSDLVKLQGQSYFAGPSIPRNIGEEVSKRKEEQRDETRSKVRERMSRK